MRLLVTGGSGFIGTNFIRYVMSSHPEHRVINCDKLGLGSNPNNLKDLEGGDRYRFVKGDISDYGVVAGIIKDVDAVVNFAAETHVDRSIADPKPFIESNVVGTFNLLEAERRIKPKIRHVQVSTDEVYGDIEEESFDEGDPLKPSNPYSASKASADMLCQAYNRTYELDVVISRCTNNYGPYQFPEKLIPKTIIRAQNSLPIPVYGTGENVRDWIYVKDHCEAIDHVLERGKRGQIYNISSDNELSTISVVEEILEILERPKELIRFVEDRPGHDTRYSLNSSKIRRETGWTPTHVFKSALRKTINWYLQNCPWWEPLINENVLHETPWKT